MRSLLLSPFVALIVGAVGCGTGGLSSKRSTGKPCARAELQSCEETAGTGPQNGEPNDVSWSAPWVPAQPGAPYDVRWPPPWVPAQPGQPYDVRWSPPWVPVQPGAPYDVRWSAPGAPAKGAPRLGPEIAPNPPLAAVPNGSGDAARSEAGTVVPTGEAVTQPCQVGLSTPLYDREAPADPKKGGSAAGTVAAFCAPASAGPMVITDLHASGACPADLFILGGAPTAPRWLLQAPARTALHVTSARLAVREGELVTIAIAGPKPAPADLRCAITWGGIRP